jgi:hypothetical protein
MKKVGFLGGEGASVMELGSEDRDLVLPETFSTPKTEVDAYIAPLIWRVGAPSIVEIEKLIGELQEAKSFLESEEERIQRELVRYIKLIQMASASIKIIFDTISGWHQAGHPMRKFVSPTDGSTGRDV